MKLEINTVENFAKTVESDFFDDKEHYYLCIHDKTEVTYGQQNDCNLEYCKNNNILAVDIKRDAGCIVATKGNISLALKYKHRAPINFIGVAFIKAFSEYLKEKGIANTIEKNDIMVDNAKTASASDFNFGPQYEWTYTNINIPIYVDIEAIKNICTKEMKKIPRGLSEWGITTKEVKQFIQEWFKNI